MHTAVVVEQYTQSQTDKENGGTNTVAVFSTAELADEYVEKQADSYTEDSGEVYDVYHFITELEVDQP